MKFFLTCTFALLFALTSIGATPPSTYKYVVKFNSECCGVPDAAPLLKCINAFKKKYKIKKLSYDYIGPMGREGEYYMAFALKELNKTQAALFIKNIDATTLKMKDKGSATTEQNMVIDPTSFSSRTTIVKKTL
jgi:hypothetical protein